MHCIDIYCILYFADGFGVSYNHKKRQKDTHGILYEADVVGVRVLDDDQLVVLLHVLHPLCCLQTPDDDDGEENDDDGDDDDDEIASWQK